MMSPVDSDQFLPPASCRHRRGDSVFIKSQNEDRERMVCAVGLDVHYELNVVAQETGAYQPRLKPFNPRMSGPACPYNYTGKFIPEAEQDDLCSDPIQLGRKIHAASAYDTALYRKHDPRLVSKTVIVRDYGCKIPINLSDTEKIAKAVLNHYPDQYISFLAEFVSNIFGESMRRHLEVRKTALQKLVDKPQELNRVSWAAYRMVQGGKSRDMSHTTVNNAPQPLRMVDYMFDCTLPWNSRLDNALNETQKNGDTLSGNLSASDMYDLVPCLRQHIQTLTDMINDWCKGFGTPERFAMAMLWFCNDQGRNMTQDLALLKETDQPDYDRIVLHVPTNFYVFQKSAANTRKLSPDENTNITNELHESERSVMETNSFAYPVGAWTGSFETSNTFIGIHGHKSPYSWGWGHPCNLTINVPSGSNTSYMHKLNQTYQVPDPTGVAKFVTQTKAVVQTYVNGESYQTEAASVQPKGNTGGTMKNNVDNVFDDKNFGLSMCAPFLRYSLMDNTSHSQPIITGLTSGAKFVLDVPEKCAREFVREDVWGRTLTGTPSAGNTQTNVGNMLGRAQKKSRVSIRDSLEVEDENRGNVQTFYRGSTSEPTYGASVVDQNNIRIRTYDMNSPAAYLSNPLLAYDTPNNVAESKFIPDTGQIGDQNYSQDRTCGDDDVRKPPQTGTIFEICKDGASVVNMTFITSCKHLDPFFTNGDNCFRLKGPDGDPVRNMMVNPRVFGYYNIEEMSRGTHFQTVFGQAIKSVKLFRNRATRPAMTSSSYGRNIASDYADLSSSYRPGEFYGYRTTIPPASKLALNPEWVLSARDSADPLIPILNTWYGGLGVTGLMKDHASVEYVTHMNKTPDPLTASYTLPDRVSIRNQPHIVNQVVDMRNIDWSSTPELTDLSFHAVKCKPGHRYMSYVLQIISLRTILSTAFGMDVAAFVCEGSIPSVHPTIAEDPNTRVVGGTANYAYIGYDSIDRNIEAFLQNDTVGQKFFKTWGKQIWSKGTEAYVIKNDGTGSGVTFTTKSGSELSDEEVAVEIYRKMAITMVFKLQWLMTISDNGEGKMDDQLSNTARERERTMHLDELRKYSLEYLLHLMVVAPITAVFAGGTSFAGQSDRTGRPAAEYLAGLLPTFKNVNNPLPPDSSEDNHFPYELSFHGRIGALNIDPRAMNENDNVMIGVQTSLFRDPRAFYAFNFVEYKRQLESEEATYGKRLTEIMCWESFPVWWTSMCPETSLPRGLPANEHLCSYFTGAAEGLTIPWLAANGAIFEEKSNKYIRTLSDHMHKVMQKKPEIAAILNSFLSTNNPTKRPKEDAYKGTEEYRAANAFHSATQAPIANVGRTRKDTQQVGISIFSPPASVDIDQDNYMGFFPISPYTDDGVSTVTMGVSGHPDITAKYLPVGPCANVNTRFGRMGTKFSLIPLGKERYGATPATFTKSTMISNALYNTDVTHPQMFAMLDAAGLLWHSREFHNPSDCNRPPPFTELGQCDTMHYWCRTLAESFVTAREMWASKNSSEPWEAAVKVHPQSSFPSNLIGSLCDRSWRKYFPLLPNDHLLREDIRRVRAMNIIWGTLPTYSPTTDMTGSTGAWMPLSVSHQMKLYNTVGLYDEKYRIPLNPWSSHNGHGISLVFNQSYHSYSHTDSYRAAHFQDWLVSACRYQNPHMQEPGCAYPFSQYGGTPVEADFLPHRVQRPKYEAHMKRHQQLVYNRFGFTRPLRIGQQYHDTGLLQDMFQFSYRPYADLSRDQRAMNRADEVFISNFMSYARTHAIIALASCNHGTEKMSEPRVVRNLYRLYVDTYECMGSNPDDDGVPVVMGFLPTPINKREDRAVTLYAGSLSCLNTKLERFCHSDKNRGERVCTIYKQVYLNDATLLYTRMLRQERRKLLHDNNFNRAIMKRGPTYTRNEFDTNLIELQDAYIEFLQTTVLGMLVENGADLNGAPLHLLEPRELEVSMYEEDDNLVGNDFLTPRTREIIKDSDFGGDNLTRTQLAILSLIPPNQRILGTLRLNQSMEVVDLEHIKKAVQKETMDSNKKVWERYSEALVSAAFAQKLLEVEGPMDFSLDMSSVQDPVKFSMNKFKDPLKESEKIASRATTTHAQASSSLSQSMRSQNLRAETGPGSVLGMTTADLNRALQAIREKVERDYQRNGGNVSKTKILAMMKVPEHMKRILKSKYSDDKS